MTPDQCVFLFCFVLFFCFLVLNKVISYPNLNKSFPVGKCMCWVCEALIDHKHLSNVLLLCVCVCGGVFSPMIFVWKIFLVDLFVWLNNHEIVEIHTVD